MMDEHTTSQRSGDDKHELVAHRFRQVDRVGGLAERTLAALDALAVGRRRILHVAANGTAEFRTIGDAIAFARDGDQIRIHAGEYRESVHVDRRLEIVGEDDEWPVISAVDGSCITIGADGSRLGKLELAANPAWPSLDDDVDEDEPFVPRALVSVEARDVVLEDLELDTLHTLSDGVLIEGDGRSAHIRGCRIYADWEGVGVGSGAEALIEGNEITGHVGAGPEHGGVVLYGASSESVVRGNVIRRAWCGIFALEGFAGTITENEIYDSGHDAMFITQPGTDPLIVGNRIVRSGNAGIGVAMGAAPSLRDNQIEQTRGPQIERR